MKKNLIILLIFILKINLFYSFNENNFYGFFRKNKNENSNENIINNLKKEKKLLNESRFNKHKINKKCKKNKEIIDLLNIIKNL